MRIWEQSVIRWAGSKKKLLDVLLAATPDDFNKYVEPFCGSACLFFALNPTSAVLNDLNPELINALETIKRHPRTVARDLRDMSADRSTYYELRKQNSDGLSQYSRAIRFLYLNRYCFNGVYRTNQKGEFNVPMGVRTGGIPDSKRYYRSHIALRGATLTFGDYFDTLQQIKKGDFVYVDPPYAKAGGRNRGEYGIGAFDASSLSELSKYLYEVDKKKAQFLFSYTGDVLEHINIAPSWEIQEVETRRHVSGFAKHRKLVKEVLISNYRWPKAN